MYQLIETIACINGVLMNVEYHQARLERSLNDLTGKATNLNLSKIKPLYGGAGKMKCRVLYSENGIDKVEFSPYKKKEISALRIIRNDDIRYDHKFLNRKKLDTLASGLKKNEDMILVRSGLVTDSWYANLAFHDGKHWYTPSVPLLPGTKRKALLDKGLIIDTKIREEDIFAFEKVSLINAMLELDEISIPINKVSVK